MPVIEMDPVRKLAEQMRVDEERRQEGEQSFDLALREPTLSFFREILSDLPNSAKLSLIATNLLRQSYAAGYSCGYSTAADKLSGDSVK
jgi:hypothetical protein